jgi:DNA-binding NtrC family response regulator
MPNREFLVGRDLAFSVASANEPKNQSELSQADSKEKEMIEAALQECGGQVFGPSGAAARLGVPRSTLRLKIRSLISTRIASTLNPL